MWQDSPSAYKDRRAYDGFEPENLAYDSLDEAGPNGHTYGGIRQLEQTSASSARHRTAAMSNPYATLHHVNRELMELGLPSPLHLAELPECLEDNERVVECLVGLLQQRKKDLGFREQMDDELRRAMGEEDLLHNTIARLERELDGAQRDAAGNKIKWHEAERVGGEVEAQRKKLAAELRTTRANAAMTRAQFVHDGKKREQEAAKLKERLQKLITDKHRTAKLAVELANPIARDRSGRPMDAASRDRRLLEELIGKYEANEGELVRRIDDLERELRTLVAALGTLHAAVVPGAEEADADTVATLPLVDAIREQISRERSQRPDAINPAEIRVRDEQIDALRAQLAALQQETGDLHAVLGEQKKAIDALTAKELRRGVDIDMLDASFSEMSMEQLEMERNALRCEKQQLEEERKRFTDAAIELGNERSELKREREEFDRQRTTQGTSDLIAGLPATPQWMRGLDTSQATPMILDQLQSMYQGTPTNAMLAGMAAASAAFTAAMGANGSVLSPQPPAASDEQFPEILSSSDSPDGSGSRESSGRLREGSSRAGRTPLAQRPAPARTPAEVRSARQPRVCTRPGCAAHAPHTHDDGTTGPVMELKPPVPRFRKREDQSSQTLPARAAGAPRPTPRTATSRAPPPGKNSNGASAVAAESPAPRTHAADIFR
ncbi:Afadin and alpha-actinin-binding-domain-containing protein [Coemansia spiralis]|nr:Afadin and alpha-actinin-binding-domain-containing protein [Coemansia spiralis]